MRGWASSTLAAVAAIGWLAMQATGRRESVQGRAARRGSMRCRWRRGFAASEILKEINSRFDILQSTGGRRRACGSR